MVRLIKAFPVKMELHIVDGYVYQYKRAAGGAARFLNYLRNQLERNVRHVQHVDLVDHGRRVGVGLGMVVWVAEGLEVVLGRLCGWVWEMVKTIFFQLVKCFKIFVNTSVFSDSTGMSTASFVSKPSIISQLNLVCQFISNQITNFYISTSIMLSLTIYLALLCQNV